MAKVAMRQVSDCPTTTRQAKVLAEGMLPLLEDLGELLKTRLDPCRHCEDGKVPAPKNGGVYHTLELNGEVVSVYCIDQKRRNL